jgi:hypothetical protein
MVSWGHNYIRKILVCLPVGRAKRQYDEVKVEGGRS